MEMTDMSGFQQSPENVRAPSPREVAVVLGRLCRYAGNVPCSVLTHTFVGAPLVWSQAKGCSLTVSGATISWWFLHDAHEVITGDFAPHKPDVIKQWQDNINIAIAEAYQVDFGDVNWSIIHEADLLARYLEAEHYGGEVFFETFKRHHKYKVPEITHRRLVGGVLHNGSNAFSKTVMDSNDPDERLPHCVEVFMMILQHIKEGQWMRGLEFYSGLIMDLGLDESE